MKNFRAKFPIILTSFIIAVIMWAVIRNIESPLVNGFINTPIEVRNENYAIEQDKAYTILDTRVARITYKVNSAMQTNVRQGDIKAYIDLNDLKYTNELTVRYEVYNNVDSYVSNIKVQPAKVHVELDAVSRNEFKVQHDIDGIIGEGHAIGSVILSPNIVYVAGSNAAVDNISRVSIDIPVENNEETFSGTSKIKIYDKNGKQMPLDDFVVSTDEIGYSVVVYSTTMVTLNPVIEGNVGTGYSFGGAKVNPSTIVIAGPKSVIQNMSNIDLPIINIEKLTESQDFTYKINEILPIGITGSVDEITVSVTVNSNIISRTNVIKVEAGPHKDDENTTDNSETEIDEEIIDDENSEEESQDEETITNK